MRVAWMALRVLPGLGAGAAAYWLCLLDAVWLALVSWALWYRTREHKLERRRDRILREELEAYASLDAILPPGGDARALAKRVCRVVSDKSAFRRSALLLPDHDHEGRLYVVASAGMDDLAVAALNAWAAQVSAPSHDTPADPPIPAHSFLIDLPAHDLPADKFITPDQLATELPTPAPLPYLFTARVTLFELHGRAILLPLRTSSGHMAGALAISPDAAPPDWPRTLEEAISPLETLAAKLARALDHSALAERLLRAEQLAAQHLQTQPLTQAAQLTADVAHQLVNPLTAVLGFAELIAESAADPRIRDDAHSILAAAQRMKAILQQLRPGPPQATEDHTTASVRELAWNPANPRVKPLHRKKSN